VDKDLMTVLSAEDGEFVEEIGAYVAVYQTRNLDEIVVEFEYVDMSRFPEEEEITHVKRFTLTVVD